MSGTIILFVIFILGLFSGFGTGVRYGYLDIAQDENDMRDTEIARFYRKRSVSILTTALIFPFPVCILMFIFLMGLCFCPHALFEFLSPETVDFLLRCVIILFASQMVAYILGMAYNQKHLKK